MLGPVLRIIAALACLAAAAPAAHAHPHVFVTMQSEIVYGPDGAITGVRHAWTFDDMFSTYALQGVDHKQKGRYTREELAPLAEVNVTSLKEYAFFTYARANGVKQKSAFADPTDYWLEYNDASLTLHFTLPLKTPLKARAVEIDVYDPEFFVDFSLADGDPVSLAGAPPQCTLSLVRPNDGAFQSQRLDKAFQTSEANIGMGANFANKIAVTCP